MTKNACGRLFFGAAVSVLVSGMGVAPISCGDKQAAPSSSSNTTTVGGNGGSTGYCDQSIDGGDCWTYTNQTSSQLATDESTCHESFNDSWSTSTTCPQNANYLGTCSFAGLSTETIAFYKPLFDAGAASFTCAQMLGTWTP